MLLSTIKVISNEETEKELWKTDELRQNAVLYFFGTGAQISPKTKGSMKSFHPNSQGTYQDSTTFEKKEEIQIIGDHRKLEEVSKQANPYETKKCPFCAEEIKKEAIVCRFCGKKLQSESSNKSDTVPFNGKREPSFWKSLLFMILLLALVYGIAIFVAGVFQDRTDIEITF